jgi:hypothetical protein
MLAGYATHSGPGVTGHLGHACLADVPVGFALNRSHGDTAGAAGLRDERWSWCRLPKHTMEESPGALVHRLPAFASGVEMRQPDGVGVYPGRSGISPVDPCYPLRGSVPLASLLLCERPLAYTRTRITRLGLQLESAPCIGMPDDSLDGVERVIGVKSGSGTFPSSSRVRRRDAALVSRRHYAHCM